MTKIEKLAQQISKLPIEDQEKLSLVAQGMAMAQGCKEETTQRPA